MSIRRFIGHLGRLFSGRPGRPPSHRQLHWRVVSQTVRSRRGQRRG